MKKVIIILAWYFIVSDYSTNNWGNTIYRIGPFYKYEKCEEIRSEFLRNKNSWVIKATSCFAGGIK